MQQFIKYRKLLDEKNSLILMNSKLSFSKHYKQWSLVWCSQRDQLFRLYMNVHHMVWITLTHWHFCRRVCAQVLADKNLQPWTICTNHVHMAACWLKPQTFLFKVALNLTLCYMLNNSSAREMVLSCRTLQRNYFKRDSNVANFSLTLLLYGDVFGG